MSAWMLIHPVDVIKTRMQLLGKANEDATALSVGKEIVSFSSPFAAAAPWWSKLKCHISRNNTSTAEVCAFESR